MKRREFIASAASSMLLPLTVNGFGIKSFEKDSPLVQSLGTTIDENSDRCLVIVYLNGGNDGLNTVIPLGDYSRYYDLRSNIAIPENKVLPLAGNLETGFHPSMTGMRDLYNSGKLGIVHSVSYPNPNQSHVRSTDIWMTGVDSNVYAETGWGARFLQNKFQGYPANYPNDTMPDPLAVQIGYIDAMLLKGQNQPMNISFDNPNEFYRMMGQLGVSPEGDLPCCTAGELINFVRQQQALSIGYSSQVQNAANAGRNLGEYPQSGTNELSDQLKIIARLIHGGLRSKIYYVELGGFDTHASQVGNTTTDGLHANLLKKLSDAVAAFQNDLKLQGTENRVIGMTFSDFGRRASSNASRGTDHGVAAPMFVFGTGIKRQNVGTNPDLTNDLTDPDFSGNRDIKMQVDFRRIYADILRDWFGTPNTITESILYHSFTTTSLFSNVIESVSSGNWADRNTWSAGRRPSSADYVEIKPGHTVTLGGTITVRNVRIGSGAQLSLTGNARVNTTG